MSINVKDVDALVVGGGFGGIRLLHLLKTRLQLKNVVAVEKGSALGGTWYWNQYPGARTDTESWVYRFSDDRDPPQWKTRYSNAEDIQVQIIDTAKKKGSGRVGSDRAGNRQTDGLRQGEIVDSQ